MWMWFFGWAVECEKLEGDVVARARIKIMPWRYFVYHFRYVSASLWQWVLWDFYLSLPFNCRKIRALSALPIINFAFLLDLTLRFSNKLFMCDSRWIIHKINIVLLQTMTKECLRLHKMCLCSISGAVNSINCSFYSALYSHLMQHLT